MVTFARRACMVTLSFGLLVIQCQAMEEDPKGAAAGKVMEAFLRDRNASLLWCFKEIERTGLHKDGMFYVRNVVNKAVADFNVENPPSLRKGEDYVENFMREFRDRPGYNAAIEANFERLIAEKAGTYLPSVKKSTGVDEADAKAKLYNAMEGHLKALNTLRKHNIKIDELIGKKALTTIDERIGMQALKSLSLNDRKLERIFMSGMERSEFRRVVTRAVANDDFFSGLRPEDQANYVNDFMQEHTKLCEDIEKYRMVEVKRAVAEATRNREILGPYTPFVIGPDGEKK